MKRHSIACDEHPPCQDALLQAAEHGEVQLPRCTGAS